MQAFREVVDVPLVVRHLRKPREEVLPRQSSMQNPYSTIPTCIGLRSSAVTKLLQFVSDIEVQSCAHLCNT